MSNISVTKKAEEKKVQTREETRASERYIKPTVDIVETVEGLTLIADIPGAVKDTLNITVEKGILAINAPVSHSMPGQPIYSEFDLAHYYREFAIPETLNYDKVKAELNNGILTLKIPLSEAAKPRKIEIKMG